MSEPEMFTHGDCEYRRTDGRWERSTAVGWLLVPGHYAALLDELHPLPPVRVTLAGNREFELIDGRWMKDGHLVLAETTHALNKIVELGGADAAASPTEEGTR